MNLKTTILLTQTLITVVFSTTTLGANECKIQYGWNTGNSFQGTFKNHSKNLYLNKGQTKNINKNRMNYVRNLKTRQVKFYLSNGASNVTLDKNQRNPVIGNYIGTPRLVKAKCLDSSAGSTQPATASALAAALRGAGKTATFIAGELKNKFSQGVNQIAVLLKNAGFSAGEVAKALKNALNASANQAGAAIKAAFNFSRKQVAAALKFANFTTQQIVGSLKNAFGGAMKYIAKAMKDIGYTSQSRINQLTLALKNVYNTTADQVAKALKYAGYQAEQVLRALKSAFNFSRTQAEQALKAAGYAANQVKAALDAVFGPVVQNVNRTTQRTTRIAQSTSQLAMYNGYFTLVAHQARPVRLHARFRTALNPLRLNTNSIRIAYSPYLDTTTGGKVAMTNCNTVYFPQRKLVNNLTNGQRITDNEVWWLLHELGHTVQCSQGGRSRFADRWFSELPPAVVVTIQSGSPDSKKIHDAMPLEQQADAFANRHLRAVLNAIRY